MFWREIRSREEGRLCPNSFSHRIRSRRISSLHLSNFKEFVSPHRGAVNSLQVDLTEGRYLLSAASDASAAVFDVQRASEFEAGGLVAKHKCLFVIDKQHEQGHKFAISSATWYPIDTGLFITGSYDHHINVWDTNTTQVVMNFKMPGKVYKSAMSPIATSHMLIASGTEDVQVRLCDIASGAFAHTLSGHRDGVMTVEWSTSSEWVLMTGGCDGAIRYWDIRRAGCFLVLDQSNSQLGRRPPLLKRSIADKGATCKAAGQNSSARSRGQQKKASFGNGTKLPTSSRLPSQLKGSAKQRLHPGMVSSHNHATAHYGAVTGLKAIEDGMYLLSAGSDSRLRLWDVESGCNTLVNFETVRLQNSKGIQLAVAQDLSLVFVPCMTSVKAFDLWSGRTSLTFHAHYECVNCCWFTAQDQMPPKEKDVCEDEDIGWKFGNKVNGDRRIVECKLCGKVVKGGITRLKQHLAHLKGNVAPCKKVSVEIQRDMMNLLKEYKDNKRDRLRRTSDAEYEIRRVVNRDDDGDDDDDDIQMEIARQQSLMQHEFEHDRDIFRASRGGYFDEGGNSRGSQFHQESQMRRAATVREGGFREREIRGRTYEPTSTPAARLRAVEVELEKDQSRKKQTKIQTGWLKKAKKKLMRAFGNWVIDTNQPFSVVDSLYTNPLLSTIHEVGPNIKAPTSYELAEVYLPEECKEMKNYIASFAGYWKERGVTIMCDGWSGITRMQIINFLVYSNRGTIFHKSVDASDVRTKDSDYYHKLMKKVVEEVGADKVVQVVTDNEAAMKAAGKKLMQDFPHLYWTACSAHCLDLILEDIAKKSNISEVINSAKKITSFIYQYNWVVNYMKKFTNGREILRAGITRFATFFISLESIVKHKTALRNMFESSDWVTSKYAQLKEKNQTAREVHELITCSTPEAVLFWTKANEILKVQEPLVKVLRLVDGDEKPTMGFIYEAMDRAKLAIQKDCRYWKQYWSIIDKRWNFQLHHHLHAAGYFFNPQYIYTNHEADRDSEVMSGVKKVIERLEPSIDNQIKALNQLFIYHGKRESFGTSLAQKAITHMDPAEWWLTFGNSAPQLQRIAVRVLSQTTSSSNCERNWSVFGQVHTKSRNRLKYKRLSMIVYLRYNMKLRTRHFKRRSETEINDGFNPINLDYIFEEDDPLAPWLEEREPAVFANDNLDWLNIDDDENDARNPINLDNDQSDQELGQSPPFRYSVDEQHDDTHATGGTGGLSPPSSDGGDAGGNNNEEGGCYEIGGSYSTRQSGAHLYSDYPVSNTRDYEREGRQTTQTFHRRRKGKDPAVDNAANSVPGGNTYGMTSNDEGFGVFFGDSSGGSNYTYNEIPYQYGQPPYPAPYDMPYNQSHDFSGYGRNMDHSNESHTESQRRDHVQIINHGTINYGDVQYHYPNFYGGYSNPSDSSWMGSMGEQSNVNYNDPQQPSDNYYDPPRRSTWW